MEYLRLGLRRRIVKVLSPRARLEPITFEARHVAGRYLGNLSNAQDWHVFFFGGYELKELALLSDLISQIPNAIVLDVGANQGGHTLTMARVAAEVHSVEPFPPLAEKIESLIKLNVLSNVIVHKVGLGAQAGQLDYFLDTTAPNQGTGSFLPDHTGSGFAGRLPVVVGDEFFERRLSKLDVIKIDIEGFEAPALLGLKKTLEQHRPIILMEVTESSSSLFKKFGGINQVIPFDFEAWEVANPDYFLGVFQWRRYRLKLLDSVEPRGVSYNILLVPRALRAHIDRLLG